MNVQEVIGKTVHGYKFVIYILNEGQVNFEAQLTSTEVIQVRANNLEEVKEFFGENLFEANEIN